MAKRKPKQSGPPLVVPSTEVRLGEADKKIVFMGLLPPESIVSPKGTVDVGHPYEIVNGLLIINGVAPPTSGPWEPSSLFLAARSQMFGFKLV
jgi:hypothetical protein